MNAASIFIALYAFLLGAGAIIVVACCRTSGRMSREEEVGESPWLLCRSCGSRGLQPHAYRCFAFKEDTRHDAEGAVVYGAAWGHGPSGNRPPALAGLPRGNGSR